MTNRRQIIPLAGLLVTIAGSGYMVARLNGQSELPSADFTSAATATVLDSQGQILLRGQFQLVDEDDDDIERKAVLEAATAGSAAAGEAEVEFSRTQSASQEVEFSVRGIAPNTALTFVIDGVEVATATTDAKGRAEIERDVRMPTATSR